MFTFIRVISQRCLPRDPSPDARKIGTHRRQIDADSARQPLLNPWETELSRLSGAKPDRQALPPSAQGAGTRPAGKQGTLTDLKIWWTQATSPSKSDSPDLKSFAPTKQRKPNRWYQ